MTVGDLMAALKDRKPELQVYIWPYDTRRIGGKPAPRVPTELKIITVYDGDEGVLLEDTPQGVHWKRRVE